MNLNGRSSPHNKRTSTERLQIQTSAGKPIGFLALYQDDQICKSHDKVPWHIAEDTEILGRIV